MHLKIWKGWLILGLYDIRHKYESLGVGKFTKTCVKRPWIRRYYKKIIFLLHHDLKCLIFYFSFHKSYIPVSTHFVLLNYQTGQLQDWIWPSDPHIQYMSINSRLEQLYVFHHPRNVWTRHWSIINWHMIQSTKSSHTIKYIYPVVIWYMFTRFRLSSAFDK